MLALLGRRGIPPAAAVPLLAGKVAQDGKVTAYVCENRVCQRPTTDPEIFAAQIQSG